MPYKATRRPSTAKPQAQENQTAQPSGGAADTALLGLQQAAGNAATAELLGSVTPGPAPDQASDPAEGESLWRQARAFIEDGLAYLADGNRMVEEALELVREDAEAAGETWPSLLNGAVSTLLAAETVLQAAADTRRQLRALVPTPAPRPADRDVDEHLEILRELVEGWRQELEGAYGQGVWSPDWDADWTLRMQLDLRVPTVWLEATMSAEPPPNSWADHWEAMGGPGG